jgi:3-hydroxy-9,10-secoandrosta-1,3,5(10)-triene-9,17-dione monooxygenase reductase component
MSPQTAVQPAAVDPRKFRDVLGNYCSGITILSAQLNDELIGMTCQSFFSVSLEPPLVAFCIGNSSSTYPRLRSADGLVVNFLAKSQSEISSSFARSGSDKWAGIDWTASARSGHPVIDGALASLDCEIIQEVPAGDHVIAIAKVNALDAKTDDGPLLYFRGNYHSVGNAG